MTPLAALALLWVLSVMMITAGWVWWRRWSPRARLRARAARIGGGGVVTTGDPAREGDQRRRQIQDKLRELEKERHHKRDTLRHMLTQSGLGLDTRDYVLISLTALLTGTLALKLMGLGWPTAMLGGAGCGALGPRLWLRHVINKRQGAFISHFADALDILVRGARSGLPIGECMRVVAAESPDPVGPEFALLTEGQRVGMTTQQAMARAVDRMPVPELRFFAVVLTVQQQTGGNLAATLENLSNVLRDRKRLRDKVIAMSAEARASAAIIGSLPFLVCLILTLVSPDYMSLLFTEKLGNVFIGAGLAWMAIGVLVMRAMIHFDM